MKFPIPKGGMVNAGPADEARAGGRSEMRSAINRSSAPTMAQWQLGVRLRTLREHRELSADDVVERLVWPLSRLRELEAGVRRPTADDLSELCALFKVDELTAGGLETLAERAQEPGWWSGYEDLRLPYLGLEEHASQITAYAAYYFPALLQTADYAHAIITGIAPKMAPEIVRQRIEVRLRRQEVLNRDSAPEYRVLLDESALRRSIGGAAVMRKQLDKILELIRGGKAAVRVVPLSTGVNVAQDSNFVLVDFATDEILSVVYVEGLAEPHYLERKEQTERYREAVGYLLDSALSQQDSVRLIVEARDAYVGN